jgi:hypothetical protein
MPNILTSFPFHEANVVTLTFLVLETVQDREKIIKANKVKKETNFFPIVFSPFFPKIKNSP